MHATTIMLCFSPDICSFPDGYVSAKVNQLVPIFSRSLVPFHCSFIGTLELIYHQEVKVHALKLGMGLDSNQ
jgi:hypothetical protein